MPGCPRVCDTRLEFIVIVPTTAIWRVHSRTMGRHKTPGLWQQRHKCFFSRGSCLRRAPRGGDGHGICCCCVLLCIDLSSRTYAFPNSAQVMCTPLQANTLSEVLAAGEPQKTREARTERGRSGVDGSIAPRGSSPDMRRKFRKRCVGSAGARNCLITDS